MTDGESIHSLIRKLYPICRSITGDGVRESLSVLKEVIAVRTHEVPTGTKAFDWSVPREWNIKDGFVKDPSGKKIIDFRKNNLHVLGYSVPFKGSIGLDELKGHLFTIPEYPDWIPYRTSYYSENWGFCLSHRDYKNLKKGIYEVLIDSSLQNGHLTFGEYLVRGETEDEVLISAHNCHPSMCNDNLSGVAVAAFLARYLTGRSNLRYSYRFLFIPGTIGSIVWLSLNEPELSRIKHGLVLAGVGDEGGFTYKKSRRGNADIDRIVTNCVVHSGGNYRVMDFEPTGYDERQYCSPGIDLPMGCLMRSVHGSYPEYHTSADGPGFVKAGSLQETFSLLVRIIDAIENNRKYVSRNPKCEPQLGKRGLYRKTGGEKMGKSDELALLWLLNLSDGRHSLLDVSERSGQKMDSVIRAAEKLHGQDLIAPYE